MKSYAVKIINKKKVDRDILTHELLVLRAIKVVLVNSFDSVAACLQRTHRDNQRDLRRRIPYSYCNGISWWRRFI